MTVNSIQCRIEASVIYCKYRKYRKYRSIVDTWLGIGIDAAQVPRYLQSIEYRPGTTVDKTYPNIPMLLDRSLYNNNKFISYIRVQQQDAVSNNSTKSTKHGVADNSTTWSSST